MPPLMIEEQKQSIAEMLAHQQREHDEISKNHAETTGGRLRDKQLGRLTPNT
jgi:hypothetical protein